jgi:hypothetical protein
MKAKGITIDWVALPIDGEPIMRLPWTRKVVAFDCPPAYN